jgi:hypothetical protein
MLGWFDKKPIRKIGFDDVKYAITHSSQFVIINTLPISEQECLIQNTLVWNAEESTLNELINTYNMKMRIIVYGKNAIDISVEKKYKQLTDLGFSEVYMYCGGMFEWLLLQDIYGANEFPTTARQMDILKYRPAKTFDVPRIGY